METKEFLDKLFYPKSVAMIEASNKREWQIKGILDRGFEGPIYLVSKSAEEILGIKCYKDVSELPDNIDHVVIAVNRKKLKNLISQCVEKGFHTLHIFTAGGAEFDEEGLKIEREVFEILKNSNTRTIGPNCMGIYSPEGKFSYGSEFSNEVGKVAFVSQSGDLTSQFILRLNSNGVYFSKVASIGNSIDLKLSEFIEYFNLDEKTEIIGVYFEGFPQFDVGSEGKKFLNALKNTKKPLLLLRGGTSSHGKRAAASHTGTIAANDSIWDAIYKQTSALKVETFEELIDSTIAFNFCKNRYPKVKSLVVITWSGGKAVIATDQIVDLGIDVPELTPATQTKMKEMISIGSVKNPLDLPWIARREKFAEISRFAINESYIGGTIMEAGTWSKIDENFLKYFQNIVKMHEINKQARKPFLLSLPHSRLYEQREQFKNLAIEKGIPVFPTIKRAAKAFLNLFEFQKRS